MAAALVDSNVLLDIMTIDPQWGEWSAEKIGHTANHSRLIINPIIYAEVSVRYSTIEALDEVLPKFMFEREPISDEAAFLAGKVFQRYRRQGGAKRSPLPDFFIGAHAAIAGYDLITRDAGRYWTYFPTLTVIAPNRG